MSSITVSARPFTAGARRTHRACELAYRAFAPSYRPCELALPVCVILHRELIRRECQASYQVERALRRSMLKDMCLRRQN